MAVHPKVTLCSHQTCGCIQNPGFRIQPHACGWMVKTHACGCIHCLNTKIHRPFASLELARCVKHQTHARHAYCRGFESRRAIFMTSSFALKYDVHNVHCGLFRQSSSQRLIFVLYPTPQTNKVQTCLGEKKKKKKNRLPARTQVSGPWIMDGRLWTTYST